MIFILLLLIILTTTFVLSIIKITKTDKTSHDHGVIHHDQNKSWKKQDIINLYNNSQSFDNDGLPNGGLLVSLLSNSYVTGHKIGSNTIQANLDYPDNNLGCYNKINVPDLTNLNKLLVDTAKENLTNCFSLDTTYMSYDAPAVLFGPVLDNKNPSTVINMSIGLIFDINKLKKYIGCMYPADSGSVGRYNTKKDSTYLTSKDFDNYDELIRTPRGKALADAGCGLYIGKQYGYGRGGIFNTPGYGINFPLSYYKNYYPYARYTKNGVDQYESPSVGGIKGLDKYPIGVIIDKDYNLNNDKYQVVDIYSSPNGWFNEFKKNNGEPSKITFNNKSHNLNMFLSGAFGLNAQPYSRKSFKYFVNQIKNKYKNIFKVYGDENLGKFFTNTYYTSIYGGLNNPYEVNKGNLNYTNFYYENEVDIYVPNISGTTKESADKVTKCEVQPDFLEMWKQCVIGIFTNHRCAEDIMGSSYQIKNRFIYPYNNLNDFNDQVKNGLIDTKSQLLGKPVCTEKSPCCCSNNNYEILDKTVIELVKKWNDNNPGNPKINGYIMNDDMKLDGDTPPDLDTKNITKPLKIKQITDF